MKFSENKDEISIIVLASSCVVLYIISFWVPFLQNFKFYSMYSAIECFVMAGIGKRMLNRNSKRKKRT